MKKTDELLLRLDYISREVDRLKAENQLVKKLAKKAIGENKKWPVFLSGSMRQSKWKCTRQTLKNS